MEKVLLLQVVSGAPLLRAEYAIIETNCTNVDDDGCVPLDHALAVSVQSSAPKQ